MSMDDITEVESSLEVDIETEVASSNLQSALSSRKPGSKPTLKALHEVSGSVRLPTDDNPYQSTITVTVAVAYPKPTDDHSKLIEELVKRNKRTVEAPKANHYLHCDYTIAPKFEPTLTDVVTYPVAAKVFTDHDSRVVKTWDDGQNIWVAWIHSHEVDITLSNIPTLHNHTVSVKLWDSKEKLSTKARGDRPKAFRLPSTTEVHFPGRGVHGVVSRLSTSWSCTQPRNSVTGESYSKFLGKDPMVEEKPSVKIQETNVEPLETVRSSIGRLAGLAGINPTEEEKQKISDLKRQQSQLQKRLTKRSSVMVNERGRKSAIAFKQSKPVCMDVKLEGLFAGSTSVTTRLTDKSSSIVDGFVTVSADGYLLPPDMEKTLNPLCIRLKCVKDLPSSPIPQTELAKVSKPVYCQYDFLNEPMHVTSGRPHGRHVYYEDTHVLFLGLLDEGELREYIQSNSFQIEVHDRDHLDDLEPRDSAIFGSEEMDKKISNVGLVSSKRTLYDAFKSKKNAFDPFGVATVSLVELLRGSVNINTEVAVTPCPTPQLLSNSSSRDGETVRLIGIPGAVDRPERAPQVPGNYLHAGTTLKINMKLCCPLVPPPNVPRLLPLPTQQCPFSRVVFYFSYKNKDLLRNLEEFVTGINARALGLENLEKHVIDAALSTYKLSVEQKRSRILDLITGFHVIDGDLHIMVLEGLRRESMKKLEREVRRTKKNEGETLVHLYDSSMSFSCRLYAALDVDLCRVRLHQTIPEIMKQSLLYVRDMVPKECLECLLKLHQMTQVKRLRDAVRGHLFPTSEMVISMSREFGIPLTYDDFEGPHKKHLEDFQEGEDTIMATDQLLTGATSITDAAKADALTKSSSIFLDNSNQAFDTLLRRRKISPPKKDYISTNIVAVQEAGKRRRPSHPTVRTLQADAPAHNYSTQTLNTTEIAKNILRDMFREADPNARYAYHPSYISAMLVPTDVDAYYKKMEEDSKKLWRTTDGLVYPGMRSSLESNQHPMKPREYRVDELKLPFKDNLLHRNVMSPVLPRERFPWNERKEDLELYKKPVPDFGFTPSVTIFSAGDRKEAEEKACKRAEKAEWQKKLTVHDPIMRFHRLLWATEDSNDSNQLDRLGSVMKDPPRKYIFIKRPVSVIPPLSVVLNPSVDTAARRNGKTLPPAFDENVEENVGFKPGPYSSRRWVLESNKIPIKDEHHQEFAKIHGHDMKKEQTHASCAEKPSNPFVSKPEKMPALV